MPPSVAVPLPLSVKVTPLGKAPLSLRAGSAGKAWPVVTVNEPDVAHREGGVVGAGDGRCLVDCEGEALRGVGIRRRCWP